MKKTTFTLWSGHLPLIHQTSRYNDERALFRVASYTMTQGAFPAHIETLEQAERLATIHAQDGEPLEIQRCEIER